MKLFEFIFLVTICFSFFISGCAASPPEATQVPTPSPEVEEPEFVPEPEPTQVAESEVVPTDTETVDTVDPISVGINANPIPPLVVMEEDSTSGFEVELAAEIAKRLYGSEVQIEWVPITSQERFSSLADGQIDMLVRSLLHTTSREEQALFSGAYLLAGNGFLVFQDEGFSSIEDLDGKNVAVVPQLEEQLSQVASELGLTLNAVVGADLAEAQGLLGFDRADALYHDWLLLAGVMDQNAHAIITEPAQLAPIGIAFPLDDQELRDQVDLILREMIADGTWQSLYDKWFGIPVPWEVDNMFETPPFDR